jgi:hypothetical protein
MNHMPTDIMASTPAGYQVLAIAGIDDLLYFLRNAGSTFVFRGQCDATWNLETRLRRRITPEWKFRGVTIRAFERQIIEHFQSRAYHFIDQPNLPIDEHNLLEWLALLQHYGGPTRFLDVTRSIFIAAYFALETDNGYENAAIWAINRNALQINWWAYRATFEELLKKFIPNENITRNPSITGELRFILSDPEAPSILRAMVYEGFSQAGICAMEPQRKNMRLIQQQALFLVPVNVEIDFISNLVCMFTPTPVVPTAPGDGINKINPVGQLREFGQLNECAIVKLIIPKSAYKDIRVGLRQMNVGVDTLFPDLEGLTKSLDQFLPLADQRQVGKDVGCGKS